MCVREGTDIRVYTKHRATPEHFLRRERGREGRGGVSAVHDERERGDGLDRKIC